MSRPEIAIWSSGSGTLKEFELHDLRNKVARQEKEMKLLKEHHDFFIDKAREWKIRALKLEKIMNAHHVPVPERHAADNMVVSAADDSNSLAGADRTAPSVPAAAATSTLAAEKENTAPTPTEDLQLVLEPGAAGPFRNPNSRDVGRRRGNGVSDSQQDCKTQ